MKFYFSFSKKLQNIFSCRFFQDFLLKNNYGKTNIFFLIMREDLKKIKKFRLKPKFQYKLIFRILCKRSIFFFDLFPFIIFLFIPILQISIF